MKKYGTKLSWLVAVQPTQCILCLEKKYRSQNCNEIKLRECYGISYSLHPTDEQVELKERAREEQARARIAAKKVNQRKPGVAKHANAQITSDSQAIPDSNFQEQMPPVAPLPKTVAASAAGVVLNERKKAELKKEKENPEEITQAPVKSTTQSHSDVTNPVDETVPEPELVAPAVEEPISAKSVDKKTIPETQQQKQQQQDDMSKSDENLYSLDIASLSECRAHKPVDSKCRNIFQTFQKNENKPEGCCRIQRCKRRKADNEEIFSVSKEAKYTHNCPKCIYQRLLQMTDTDRNQFQVFVHILCVSFSFLLF